jgi:hypothetical protein
MKPKKKCCKKPDVKNEGSVQTPKGKSWEYHCYACGKSWTEIEKGKQS